jgi:hypothetical protein
MAQFDPFSKLSCAYGAPMGRHGDCFDQLPPENLYIRHCGGDGYYDKGGAYWGHNSVYAVFTRDGDYCAYIEASHGDEALRKVKAKIVSIYG